jgi:hypothetical protein
MLAGWHAAARGCASMVLLLLKQKNGTKEEIALRQDFPETNPCPLGRDCSL